MTATAVLGCPDCDWRDSSAGSVEVTHLCGEGDVLSCDTCGWHHVVHDGERPSGYVAAMVDVHLTRPNHVDPRVNDE